MTKSVGADLATASVLVGTGSLGTSWLLGLPASYLWQVAGLWAGVVGLLIATVPPALPGSGVGPANRITLLRAILIVPLAAFAFHGSRLDTAVSWGTILVATTAMVLDGLDGWVARRTGTSTAFGARFDMELDAFLMAALSALVWQSGKVGSWVLLIGALRYLFVLAGRICPVLRGDLPGSVRRKAVCVVEGVVLLTALGPIVPSALAVLLCAGGLAALLGSFGADILWLSRSGESALS